MKYPEQLKFANQATEMIANGASRQDIDAHLEEQGVEKWDIKKVNQALDRQLRDQHKARVRGYMEDQTLAARLDEFDDLGAETFEKLQHEVIAEMQAESRQKIRSMMAAEATEEEILTAAQHQFFDADDVLAYLDQQNESRAATSSRRNQGIGLIILGVILSIGTIDMIPGGVVFSGLIVWGIVTLVKSD